MLKVSDYSSYSAGYNTTFSGVQKVSKAFKATTPKVTNEVKQKLTLGAILTGLFTAKNAKTENKPATKYKNTYREEKIYDKNGRLIEVLKYSNADDVLSIKETLNPETGKFKEKVWYKKDGINEQMRELYDKTGDKQNLISYNKFGNIEWIETYGKKSINPIEVTWFDKNGNMSEQIKCDEETGDIENRFIFDKDTNLVEISDVAGLTGKTTKTTNFNEDGSKVVREFDIVTGEKTGEFVYNPNNKLTDFNVKNERVVRDSVITKKDENFADCKIEKPKQEYTKQDAANIAEFLQKRAEMEYSE